MKQMSLLEWKQFVYMLVVKGLSEHLSLWVIGLYLLHYGTFLFLQGRELDGEKIEPHCDGMIKLFIKSCYHLEICCLNIGASFSRLDPKHKGERSGKSTESLMRYLHTKLVLWSTVPQDKFG